jgi:copper chaperone CopZ
MAAIRTMTYPVRGFHCSGCADNLGGSLRQIEGVIKADADFEAAAVEVRFDPSRVSDDDLREGIRAAGFEPA